MSMMTKHELIDAAYDITGGSIEGFDADRLRRLMTITQYVTDLCLNELERRNALTYSRATDRVIVPYQCGYMVDTILTRSSGPHDEGKLTKSEGADRAGVGFARFEGVLNAARTELENEQPDVAPDELEEMFLAFAGF